MKALAVFALILSLAASPVLAGMIQGQEADEAAVCELRGASMVTPAPENSVVFPQHGHCVSAEVESRELAKDDGTSAGEIAGYLRVASE